ncbi:MAG: DUF2147 domain-containing protein [Terracidiphilus sp.]|jgi:uncharacterized protein (DUF2147 family)
MLFPSCHLIRRLVLAAAFAVALRSPAPAQAFASASVSPPSPVGRWKTVDHASGKVKSIVAIREQNGKLYGTIEKLFDPPVAHPTCYLCSGAMKDRPLVGLQVLWGFGQDGSQWSGGQVLDPETGKIYRASLTVEDGGNKLRLRGYIGVPLLGRTEHWLRAE